MGIVTTPVKGFRVQTTEVANTRNGNGNQALEELVHTLATQGYLTANRPAFTDLEACNRLASVGYQGLLTGNCSHVRQGTIHRLTILGGLTYTHVQGDLGDLWHFHDITETKLFFQFGHDFVLINLFQITHGSPNLQRFAVGLEETHFFAVFKTEAHTIRFLRLGVPDGNVGSVKRCFLFYDAALSTTVRIGFNMFLDHVNASNDKATVVQNLPNGAALTFVLSRNYDDFVITLNLEHYLHPPLQNFRCQGDDLHKLLGTQLPRYRAEDPGTDRCFVVVQQHRGVFVETH